MTNKEAKEKLYMEWQKFLEDNIDYAGVSEAYKMAFKALEQEPCEDAISRQEVLDLIADYDLSMGQVVRGIHALPSVIPQEPRKGHCKDCKWWKDSDGAYRRGARAESQCPINRKEVYEGNGYCYMFEPQESENKDEVMSRADEIALAQWELFVEPQESEDKK